MKWFKIIVCEIIISLLHLTTQQSQIVKDVCGKRGANVCPKEDSISTRVTGGDATCAERVPWNVLVENRQTIKDGEIEPYCGGVLISEKHVLSAAHCFWTNSNQFGVCPERFENFTAQDCANRGCPRACTRVPLKDIKLHLGLTNRLKPDSSFMRDVAKIDIHPGWDRGSKLNDILEGHDIVVLTMTRTVDIFDSRIKPACLPPLNYLPQVNSEAEVSGFGAKQERDGSKNYPPIVNSADLSIKSFRTCSRVWETSGNQICAYGRLSPTIDTDPLSGDLQIADSCNGDSGGGLTQTRQDGREMVIGTISFGEPECGKRNGKPGVYTNIGEPDNLQWITRIVDKDTNFGNPGSQACFASNNKRCVFPFKFQGELFASCTTTDDPDNKPWCSTQVDEQRNHVVGEGEWGHCPSSCLVDITASPSGNQNIVVSPGSSWSEWSSCSQSCGGGVRSRTNSLCPRSVSTCVSSQRENCNTDQCPTSRPTNRPVDRPGNRPTSGGSTNNSNEDDFQTSLWIVDGTDEQGWIEQFQPGQDGRGKSVRGEKLPAQRNSACGAQVGDEVYVCGGSSGSFGKSTVHSECFVKNANLLNGGGWKKGPEMEYKTSNAASASFGRKLYVFGGFKRPFCDITPQVQVLNTDSQRWSSSFFMDPPDFIGGYQCAAASDSKIYITGGYYERSYVDSNKCKEEPTSDERTTSNRDKENYKNDVNIFSPKSGTWRKGPKMMHRRRNHGCAVVTLGGKQVLLVAGGYNPEEYFLDSVEFITLGSGGRSWERLSSLNTARGNRLGLFQVRNLIYAVSGELGDGKSVEVYNGGSQSNTWTNLGDRLLKEKAFSTMIPVKVNKRSTSGPRVTK